MSRETDTMGCRRAFDVDLVACLLDRNRPEWQAFRDHYPTCPACAAEVRTWTELHAELAPIHPAPEALVRYEDDPEALRPGEREAIVAHVTACPACRDELRTLRATDLPALVRAGSAAAGPVPARAVVPRARRRRGLGARLRAVVWHPGFAYATALLLLIPALAPYRNLVVPTPASRDALHDEAAAERPVARREAELAADTAVPPAAPAQRADAAAVGEAYVAGARSTATSVPLPWPRLDMTPDTNHLVIAASPGLIVALPVPGDVATAGPATLVVHDPAGRRVLREEYFGPPTRRVTMRVPGEWLRPGRYVVELELGGEAAVVAATLEVVAAPAPRRP